MGISDHIGVARRVDVCVPKTLLVTFEERDCDDMCPWSLSKEEEMETGTCRTAGEKSLGEKSKFSRGVTPGARKSERAATLWDEVVDLCFFVLSLGLGFSF